MSELYVRACALMSESDVRACALMFGRRACAARQVVRFAAAPGYLPGARSPAALSRIGATLLHGAALLQHNAVKLTAHLARACWRDMQDVSMHWMKD